MKCLIQKKTSSIINENYAKLTPYKHLAEFYGFISENFDKNSQSDIDFQEITDYVPEESPGDEPSVDRKWVRCRNCNNKIALTSDKIRINDADTHLFKNPVGIFFTIMCFSSAPGIINITGHTDENTWFNGYSWSISICVNCGSHLGWHYLSGNDGFYGLITYRLRGV